MLRFFCTVFGIEMPSYRVGQLVELVSKGPRPGSREYIGIHGRRWNGKWVYDGQVYEPKGDRIMRTTGISSVSEESLGLVVC